MSKSVIKVLLVVFGLLFVADLILPVFYAPHALWARMLDRAIFFGLAMIVSNLSLRANRASRLARVRGLNVLMRSSTSLPDLVKGLRRLRLLDEEGILNLARIRREFQPQTMWRILDILVKHSTVIASVLSRKREYGECWFIKRLLIQLEGMFPGRVAMEIDASPMSEETRRKLLFVLNHGTMPSGLHLFGVTFDTLQTCSPSGSEGRGPNASKGSLRKALVALVSSYRLCLQDVCVQFCKLPGAISGREEI